MLIFLVFNFITFCYTLPVKDEATIPVALKQKPYYTIKVGVGTPPQYLNLVLDTSSAHFLILDGILSTQVGKDVNTFKPLQSSTFHLDHDLSSFFLDTYRNLYLTAVRATETVTINGFKVKNQKIELVKSLKVIDNSTFPKIDGVLGIGFKLSESPYKYFDFTSPFHDYVKSVDSVFTVYNRPDVKDNTKSAGVITLGRDTENCGEKWVRPRISWLPQQAWVFTVNGYMVGNVGYRLDPKTGVTLDSGLEASIIPKEAVENMAKHWNLKKEGDNYYIECDKVNDLAYFTLIVSYPNELIEILPKRMFKKSPEPRVLAQNPSTESWPRALAQSPSPEPQPRALAQSPSPYPYSRALAQSPSPKP
ncbi:unnamed protein product [Bursaphelenchus okinawaensis]|uniref:Peptidase A1 domain-containing protein n=1 Tax=Bursaphelenchus okinawaensis TaxID=465554 RepID=A0A811K1X0_9BILA|nr:unnamed protein product [Bursaphelenchus okinawaensis]CAG9090334.1 unnamed protein product [Bursaphelenchus okinawaensis]